MSELKPKPIIVELGFLKILLIISSSTFDFYRLTKSSRKASFAPLIWNKLGLVLWY